MARRRCHPPALLALTLLVAACTGSEDAARRDLADMNNAVSVIAGEAATLEPAAYAEVRRLQGELQASFERGDYRGVVAAAPQLRASLAALRGRVAATRAAALAAQNAEWSRYADSLPDRFAALERRLDGLAAARRPADARIDIAAAQGAVRAAVALWSKGQSAFAAGNLGEALQAARDVQARTDQLEARLRQLSPVGQP